MAPGKKIDIAGKVEAFEKSKADIDSFLVSTKTGKTKLGHEHVCWCYEYAIIRLYCAFEQLMLDTLTAVLNKNPKTFEDKTGIKLKAIQNDLAEYIIVGNGYFDFKGRDGLIKIVKSYVADGHWLIKIVTDDHYKDSLEQLSAFRNYAAHSGNAAKFRARKVTGKGKIAKCGKWLSTKDKGKTRYQIIAENLSGLANEIKTKGG